MHENLLFFRRVLGCFFGITAPIPCGRTDAGMANANPACGQGTAELHRLTAGFGLPQNITRQFCRYKLEF